MRKQRCIRLLSGEKGLADPAYIVVVTGLAMFALWVIWRFGCGG